MTDLLTALKQLRENGPKNRDAGICSQFDLYGLYSSEQRRQFRDSFKTWQYYSGDPSFPAPGTAAAIDAYFDKSNDLWGPQHSVRSPALGLTGPHHRGA